jgi:hypothetical protein
VWQRVRPLEPGEKIVLPVVPGAPNAPTPAG